MKLSVYFITWVMAFLVSCTLLHESHPDVSVWVCTHETHNLISLGGVKVQTMTPEEAIELLLSGKRPDAVVYQKEADIAPVGYFFHWQPAPHDKSAQSMWKMQISRGSRTTELKDLLKNWAQAMQGVSGWEDPPPNADILEAEKLLRKLANVKIKHASYQKLNIEDVINDLNQRAMAAGLGQAPVFIYEPSDHPFLTTQVTFEVTNITLLDTLKLVTDITHFHYVFDRSHVIIRPPSQNNSTVVGYYRIDPESWQLWMEIAAKAVTKPITNATATFREDPFYIPEKDQVHTGSILQKYGVIGVMEAEYEELSEALIVVLPPDQIPQLELILFKIHESKP